MVTKTITYSGNIIVNDNPSPEYFIIDEEDGLVFDSKDSYQNVNSFARINHQPLETSTPIWNSVKYGLIRQGTVNPTDFELIVELFGITQTGSYELIGEDIITTCPLTETEETRLFDFSNCHNTPSFSQDTGTVATGKIGVNLPFRMEYFETVTLNRSWLDVFSKRVKIPVTNTEHTINYPQLVTVTYDGDMQSDFDDIRFTLPDGITELDYYLKSKTNNTTATFNVKLPEYGIGEVNHIYCHYGDNTVTTASNGFNTFTFFDDFEDGLYTGRTSPYTDWTLTGGTVTFETSTPLSGTTSLKHTGNGLLLTSLPDTPNVTKYDIKLTTQGTGANTPYITLWTKYLDSSHYLSIYTLYNSGTNKQRLGLGYQNGGTWTSITEVDWTTGKAPLNGQWEILVIDAGTSLAFFLGSVLIFNPSYSLPFTPLYLGIGAVNDTQIMIDLIKNYPYYYSPPTIGTFGTEESYSNNVMSPDTYTDNDTQLLFTLPGDWLPKTPVYLAYNEKNNTTYNSMGTISNATNTLRLGYNGLDMYNTLGLNFKANSNNENSFNIPFVEFKYEVI